MSTYDVNDFASAIEYCTHRGYDLAKWDTLDKFEDCSFIASQRSLLKFN